MSFAETIKSKPRLKKFVHWLLVPKNEARPRISTILFINPFFHKHGRGAVIRGHARIDVFPFYEFRLGKHSTIEDFCCINNGVGDVIIGNDTHIGISNMISGPVTIGNNVILAQNICLSGLNHGYADVTLPIHKQKVSTATITIEDECWLGSNVVVAAGVTIGKHSVIGAGSVVTKSIPPYSVAVGNPARVIKSYDFDKKEWVRI